MRRLTRKELYALVWATPLTKVAKQFDLSDVALHKICRKHNVPTPPQGYRGASGVFRDGLLSPRGTSLPRKCESIQIDAA